ncbi:hypothetical protein CVU76_01475 [Candidatus Dojkabacteria bacterium HGW-Dojkabacteria-1]|uniref:Uncharacterized protein n=1 Tax=Candidatus Dojkabacteria bacterium HGW-Dojkabacteria-1 TaxID=2013761 RepID=A0A2N2F3A4_9BACT|nr:MAG: hypothetical protein CVU76_01475 [Candidatus Dojkabacteria bacterium HGW-Dojkabacteria-1]
MNEEKLEKRVQIVLTKEISDINSRIFTFFLDSDSNFSYPNSEILQDLYHSIEETNVELRSSFVKLLLSRYDINTLPIRSWTLFNLGHKDKVLEHIQSSLYNNLSNESSNIFSFIDLILEENLISLSTDELFDLRLSLKKILVHEFFQDLNNFKEEVLQKLIDLSIIGLKGELRAVNIEINKDVKEVKRIIKYIDLDEKYNEFLTEIDEHLNTKSRSISAGLINDFRSFFSDLVQDIAKRISSVEGDNIPKYKDPEGKNLRDIARYRRYLKIKLELSDRDDDLITSFVGVLHKEGGHSFVSNKEYFRLSRNIAIEITLLLLSKMLKKYPKKEE